MGLFEEGLFQEKKLQGIYPVSWVPRSPYLAHTHINLAAPALSTHVVRVDLIGVRSCLKLLPGLESEDQRDGTLLESRQFKNSQLHRQTNPPVKGPVPSRTHVDLFCRVGRVCASFAHRLPNGLDLLGVWKRALGIFRRSKANPRLRSGDERLPELEAETGLTRRDV